MSLGPETPIEHMIRKILEEKLRMEQERILDSVEVIRLKKGTKIHNLYKSFNVVIQGSVRNNDSGIVHGPYEILADFPFQINLVVRES